MIYPEDFTAEDIAEFEAEYNAILDEEYASGLRDNFEFERVGEYTRFEPVQEFEDVPF